ncbi:DUF368 domain-containing protein [Candidatus Nomurabacteria bacterium]|uniref:DUF368 domain-containing protein n=1 Tax=Candidatus Dojkabacteria bacterium TaxID=2099670 RepID=A0A955I0T1_9BACT|nr:DUF368 domain-containing protein [Candidatus Dojkabacteria bacterium]MCB9790135.1 DUF368 domain-containing protein [Candidatus Nomurabacteria bacterium]MCB9803345.1 DUF368 domain-containing protein [Candidatus Nomurabacteria bacterium]
MRNFLNGFLMGAAEILPAINGSIVALLLGVYEKRIEQIAVIMNSFKKILSDLRKGKITKLSEIIKGWDITFIGAATVGLVIGTIALTFVVMGIFENTPHYALAFIMGLVVAVIPIPIHYIDKKYVLYLFTAVFAVLSWYLLGMQNVDISQPSPIYLAFAGFTALSGMIVPGLSGSFILLVLGVYYSVISNIKDIITFNFDLQIIINITAFSLGSISGLAISSKLIKHLMDNHIAVFMSVILGLVIGSFREVYPFVINTAQDGLELEKVAINSFDSKQLVFMAILFLIPAVSLGYSNIKKIRSGEFNV